MRGGEKCSFVATVGGKWKTKSFARRYHGVENTAVTTTPEMVRRGGEWA